MTPHDTANEFFQISANEGRLKPDHRLPSSGTPSLNQPDRKRETKCELGKNAPSISERYSLRRTALFISNLQGSVRIYCILEELTP
jgi:hypothetical protein